MIIFLFDTRYSVSLCVEPVSQILKKKEVFAEKLIASEENLNQKNLLPGHLLTMDTLTFLSKLKWLK